MMSVKFHPAKRKRAREYTLQALYQWWLTGVDVMEIERQFQTHQNLAKADAIYFHHLLTQITALQPELDEVFIPYLDRAITALNPVELQAIRIGCYELIHERDIPYKVAINEAVELGKRFGATDGYKYINGILDKVAKQLLANQTEQTQDDQ
jgi:transcription antitermination protein NusB